MGQKVSLPDAPPPNPGAGGEAPKSPTGGQLYKFEGEAYALFHPNVTPELFDDGDDEAPQWILDVRVSFSVRGAHRPNVPPFRVSSRAISRRRAPSAPRATRTATGASRDRRIFVPLSFIVGTPRFFSARAATDRPLTPRPDPYNRPQIGETSFAVSERCRMVSNNVARRVDFLAPSVGVFAIRFHTPAGFAKFLGEYKDALFENTHGCRASDENRQKVFGVSFAAWANGEDHPEAVWDVTDEAPPNEAKTATRAISSSTKGPSPNDDDDDANAYGTPIRTPSGEDALDMKMGALENSFLVRGNAVDVFRNRAGGALENAGVRVQLRDGEGERVTPTKGFLADAERSMFLLSPDGGRREKLYQMDLERESVIAEWGCRKDGVDVPMSDIVADTKSSQMETGRHTFLGLDDNRLVRWDARVAGGLAQTLASPTLGYRDGHDFARGTKFRCMATTGDGCIAVGSEDGKIRLYGDSSMRQAKTSFPGLGSPITHIDVTYDGKWILATTSTCLVLLHTVLKDPKTDELTNGFKTKAGERLAAPRLLKLKPEDAARAKGAPLTRGKFTWVTEQGKQERWIVASCQNYSILFNFRRVKTATAPDARLMEFTDYNVVGKDSAIAESTFVHEKFTGDDTHLVIATTKGDVFCAGG